MKKMKNLFMAFLVATLMVPVLDALEFNPNTSLETLKIGEATVDLTACTENTEATDPTYVCEVEVPYNAGKLTLTATPKSGASLSTQSADLVSNGLDYSNLEENGKSSFSIIVEKTSETSASYTINVTKKEASKPYLKGISASVGTLSPNFAADNYTYNLEVPYGTKKVSLSATSDADVTIDGIGDVEITDGDVKVIKLTRGSATTSYEITIVVGENPLIADIEKELEKEMTDDSAITISDYSDSFIKFVYTKVLEGESFIAKQYTVSITKDSTAESVITSLKEAMKGDSDLSILLPDNGNVTDENLEAIKKDGSEILIPTDSDVVWVIDGSKLTDTDKGFNANVSVGEEVAKELADKINKLLNPKDKGLIIDFEHSGNLPKGTKVIVSVQDRFAVGDVLSLYYYNEKTGKLELAKSNLKVTQYELDGEVEDVVIFELEHCSSYVLLPASNNAQTGVTNVLFYGILALASLAGIVLLLKKKAN